MSIADIVHEWHRQHCGGGALARDTEAYNQVSLALPALIEALRAPPAASEPAAGPSGEADLGPRTGEPGEPSPTDPPAEPAA